MWLMTERFTSFNPGSPGIRQGGSFPQNAGHATTTSRFGSGSIVCLTLFLQ